MYVTCWVPSVIRPQPLKDVNAIAFFGNQVIEKHPVLKSWAAGSQASVPIESMFQPKQPYSAVKRMRLESDQQIAALSHSRPLATRCHLVGVLVVHAGARFARNARHAPQPNGFGDRTLTGSESAQSSERTLS